MPDVSQDERWTELKSMTAASELFAARGAVAFIWANRDLDVIDAVGPLTGEVVVGTALTLALPALFGLETDIQGLRETPGATLDVPNTSLRALQGGDDAGEAPRVDITVVWDEQNELFTILLVRALSWQPLQRELERNVRARRLAESMLLEQAEDMRETNAALARLNQELGELVHVISHDLKAPMRAMRYFADDLEQSLRDPATGEPRAHLARLKAQSRRMTAMLTDLVAFAKVDRKSDAVTAVDTNVLIEEVVASLPRLASTTVHVSGAWPRITTLTVPFDLALRNLIENAIRYAKIDDGRVTVDCKPTPDWLSITVSDNGPGIPREHHAAVFQPFTQLGKSDAECDLSEGTGMGLALVKRAAEGVGGKVTLTSNPDRTVGATFRLAWPRQIAADF
ncbi:MAG: HAMP domain-containing sensor histidine kinase [Pseudomonadota bacterium]